MRNQRHLYRLLALLLALLAAMPALADDGVYGIIVGEGLNMRSAASMNGSLLGAYGKGERVKIITEQDGWYRVIAPDGVTGYMSAQYIELESGSSAPAATEEGESTLVFGEPQATAVAGPEPVYFTFGAPSGGTGQLNPPTQEMLGIGEVQQSGKQNVRKVSDASLTFSVEYPVLDSTQANAALRRWIDNTLATAQARADEGLTVEVSAAYDSYFVQGRYVSVLVVGTMSTSAPERTTVAYAMNIDTWTGDMLQYTDIFGANNAYAVLDLVHDALAGQGEDPVRSLAPDALSYAILANEGVFILVPELSDKPARAVLLSYAELIDGGLVGTAMDITTPVEYDPNDAGWQEAALAAQAQAEGDDGEAAEAQAQPSDEAPPAEEAKTRKLVALTFDDGPAEFTPQILDVLAAHGAKATFFVVGNRVRTYPEILIRTAQEGHEIGTHTWSHEKLTSLERSDISKQIDDSLYAITSRIESPVRLLRPPYGSYNSDVRSVCRHRSMGIALWDIDTLDWKTKDADATYDAIMKDVCNGTVILCHDLQESTAKAMERVVPELIARGYELVTMSEMIAYADGEMEAGRVYASVELPEIPDPTPAPTATPEPAPAPTTEHGDTVMVMGTVAPDAGEAFFYNPKGGRYYHHDSRCWTVDSSFFPLTQIRGQEAQASSLKPCPTCVGE